MTERQKILARPEKPAKPEKLVRPEAPVKPGKPVTVHGGPGITRKPVSRHSGNGKFCEKEHIFHTSSNGRVCEKVNYA